MSAAGCRRVYGGGMEGALLIANEMGSDTFNYPGTWWKGYADGVAPYGDQWQDHWDIKQGFEYHDENVPPAMDILMFPG